MTDNEQASSYAASVIQKTALAVGIVFLIVGFAGFIPGLTHPIDHLEGAGAGSEALLLGLFQVSILHNIVHLLFGVAGVAAAARATASRQFLIWGGVVYFVLFIVGLFLVGAPQANFIPVNAADNWLHLVLSIGMVALGLLVGRDRTARTRRTA